MADLRSGILGSSSSSSMPAMPIDGGKIFKQSTDASKGGKDKGYPMQPIAAAPSASSLSRGAEFTRANAASVAASVPKVTMASPTAPKINTSFKSMNAGPMFSGGMRGGMMSWGGNPFGKMD